MAASLESLGHEVTRLQEGEVRATEVAGRVEGHDLFMWVQTYGLAETGGTRDERDQMVHDIRAMDIPSVGFHLDRWWGLSRQGMVPHEPFFRLDTVFTADGGHEHEWRRHEIRHVWSPPAVYHAEAVDGTPRDEYRCDVAFVGSWRGYGHTEWRHRPALIRHLKRRYGRGLKLFPQPGQPAVRGADLADLYASARVVVGDSCLVPATNGSAITRYCSDRIPETLGRGGVLVHPSVEGITDGLYRSEQHLLTWNLYDWGGLDRQVARLLEDDDLHARIKAEGSAHVRALHTYQARMAWLLEVVGA